MSGVEELAVHRLQSRLQALLALKLDKPALRSGRDCGGAGGSGSCRWLVAEGEPEGVKKVRRVAVKAKVVSRAKASVKQQAISAAADADLCAEEMNSPEAHPLAAYRNERIFDGAELRKGSG